MGNKIEIANKKNAKFMGLEAHGNPEFAGNTIRYNLDIGKAYYYTTTPAYSKSLNAQIPVWEKLGLVGVQMNIKDNRVTLFKTKSCRVCAENEGTITETACVATAKFIDGGL